MGRKYFAKSPWIALGLVLLVGSSCLAQDISSEDVEKTESVISEVRETDYANPGSVNDAVPIAAPSNAEDKDTESTKLKENSENMKKEDVPSEATEGKDPISAEVFKPKKMIPGEKAEKAGAYVLSDTADTAFGSRSGRIDDAYAHIDGRISPGTQYNNNGQPYVITESRLNQLRERFVYPYYDMGGEHGEGDHQKDIHASNPQIHKNFNFQLPFFGFRYNYTRVSMHGYLEFSDPPSHFTYPLTFPVKDWPKENDPAFIGIFYSKCRIGSIRTEDVNQMKPGVYFRMERDLQTRTDQMGVEMRERLMWDIRKGVIGAETFIPKHSAIVTWKNMSFNGGIGNSLFKTNSFQMVLATDEVFTYALFNYIDLQWSTHTEAGGDTTNGEGGVPAYIGFNGGNGTQSYEYKPYSQSLILRDLTGRGWGNNKPGRHIFRIDEKILVGSCNKDIDGANLPLMFAPESGNMLGGTIVNVTGPCFEEKDRVTCRFDTEDVVGKYVGKNIFSCVQPPLLAQGYVRLEIAVNTETYKWKGKYFVETPQTATERIFFETGAVHEKYPAEIKITWDRRNLTTNDQLPIAISLWGYKENTIRPHFTYIDMLEPSTQNNGEYVIVPGNFRLRDNLISNDIQFGFLQINLTKSSNDNHFDTPILWSKPIPLGWYFASQWERLYGKKWPERMCNNWLRSDRFLKNFAAEVPHCPCTLEHALLDKGRFLPDFDCDKDSNPKCFYNKGAIHCVKTAIPSGEGSGQQCCYDKNSFLMLSYDQQWGSRPQRSHNLGFLPWNEANKVPTLSNWYHDQIPFYQCCIWQEEQAVGCETFRFERRPTQDCVAYQAPGVAGVFGDPHFITFDNNQYTFNGHGEFVLLRTDVPELKLDVQGRFEQLPNNLYGPVRATQLTSVVAAGNSSSIIEVRLRPSHAQWRYRLDVFADGRRVFFDRPSLKVQHFPGVVVYTPTYILNQSEVIMMFQSGAGVEVVENQGFMTARVYLPWTYINKTRGLFGNWSWEMNDDFTKPDGSFSGANVNDFYSMHNDFGKFWMLSDRMEEGIGTAMFTREFGRTASYFNNATFLPIFSKEPKDFLPSNRTDDINRATDLCGESYQCRYDYGMSLSRDLAHFTRNYYDSIINIRETNSKRIISCGVLETPRFGRKTNFFFVPGTKVTLECNKDFILVGDERRTCLDEGRWDIPVYGYTECLRTQEYSSRQAGMTGGIIIGVMLPIFLLLICVWFCCFKRGKRGEEPKFNLDSLSTRSRSNSRANLRSASLGNLTDPYDDGSYKRSAYARQQSEPNILREEPVDRLEEYEPEDKPIHETTHTTKSPPPQFDKDTFPSKNLMTDHLDGFKELPRKKRNYENSYRTKEPLVGHPNGEFPVKLWELTEEDLLSSASNDGSDHTNPTLSRPASDIEYVNKNVPKQYGRRGNRDDSGVSTLSSQDSPLYVGYNPKFDDQSSTMSSQYSPAVSEVYTPSTSPSNTTSRIPMKLASSSPIVEEPQSAPAFSKLKSLFQFKKGKSTDNLATPDVNAQPQPNLSTLPSTNPDEVTTLSSRTTMV